MGKYYMKKKKKKKKASKVSGKVEESVGVRTRAKTLALHSYLHLRNRRLHKLHHSRPNQVTARKNPKHCSTSQPQPQPEESGNTNTNGTDFNIEASSCGENVLDRGTRESTPCNLIRDPDIIRTPGSTTRSSGLTGASRGLQNSVRRDMPLACELDEFFTAAEKEEQKSFIDKYNFDPANDSPLSGHFQWEKVSR